MAHKLDGNANFSTKSVTILLWLPSFVYTVVYFLLLSFLQKLIAPCEKVFGTLAILVQLGILATVDKKPIHPDPNILSTWFFRGVQFAAHFAVFVVHIPFLKISHKIDTKQAVPGHYMESF